MKNKKLIITIAGVLMCLGIVSQIVEKNIDKAEIKTVFTEKFVERDEQEDFINFEE